MRARQTSHAGTSSGKLFGLGKFDGRWSHQSCKPCTNRRHHPLSKWAPVGFTCWVVSGPTCIFWFGVSNHMQSDQVFVHSSRCFGCGCFAGACFSCAICLHLAQWILKSSELIRGMLPQASRTGACSRPCHYWYWQGHEYNLQVPITGSGKHKTVATAIIGIGNEKSAVCVLPLLVLANTGFLLVRVLPLPLRVLGNARVWSSCSHYWYWQMKECITVGSESCSCHYL